ncbi:phosphatidate cytidylyltransferase, partial [Kickxella alabastrina]
MGKVSKKSSNSSLPAGTSSSSVDKSPSKLRNRNKANNNNNSGDKTKQEEFDSGGSIIPAEDSKKKWRNWRQRTTFTFVMIAGFATVIALGPLSIMLMVLCLQVLIYREVISLSSVPKKERDLPWSRAMNAYFLICLEYYLYGHNAHRALKRHPWLEAHLQFVFAHHTFISFSLYLIGFVWFVSTLRKGSYRFQMGQFAWTHMALGL